MAREAVSFAYPTDYVRNPPKRGGTYLSSLPPDRFVSIPGRGNYRSGRIHTFQQLKMLRDKFGITRIVNLALDSMGRQKGGVELLTPESSVEFKCSYPRSPCEPQWAKALGMEYRPVYLGSSPPSTQQWEAIKGDLVKGRTLVHCTWGVDRTGAVAGRWIREVVGLTNDQLLAYTYSFGGQWKKAADPNRKLRAWMLAGTVDRQLQDRLSAPAVSPLVVALVDVSNPQAMRTVQAEASRNPLDSLLERGTIMALAGVGGLAALGGMRNRRRGSRALITKYTALNKAEYRYRSAPGFSQGRIVRKVKGGWLISFSDKTGRTRHTVVGGHEDRDGRVYPTFRAPTQREVPR